MFRAHFRLADTIFGEYATAAIFEGDPRQQNTGWIIIGGDATSSSDLPTQAANYQGAWILSDGSADGQGYYTSRADFDAGSMAIRVFDIDGIDEVGSGSATLNGAQFQGSLNTDAESGIAAQTNLNGSFFGPQAAEMAGRLNGQAGNNAAIGYIIGSKTYSDK